MSFHQISNCLIHYRIHSISSIKISCLFIELIETDSGSEIFLLTKTELLKNLSAQKWRHFPELLKQVVKQTQRPLNMRRRGDNLSLSCFQNCAIFYRFNPENLWYVINIYYNYKGAVKWFQIMSSLCINQRQRFKNSSQKKKIKLFAVHAKQN